jgi:hypothetical protein
MKLLHYIIFIIKIENVELYFIKNQNKPICANCKYFIPTNNECSKFGEINIITNEHTYEEAIIVRTNDDKCGEDAMFFKQNYFKFITIPYYSILDSIIENKDTINLLLSVVVTPILLTFFIFYCSLQLFKC